MEKRDYIWVAIRVFGIYMLVQTAFALGMVAIALVQVFYLSSSQGQGMTHGDMYALGLTGLASSIPMLVICLPAGLYLTFGGKVFIRWICPPDEKPVTRPERDDR